VSFGADKPGKARAMIAAKGSLVQYAALADGTFDAASLTVSGGNAAPVPVRAVMRDIRLTMGPDVAVKVMRVLMVAALDVPTPKAGDLFSDASGAWLVKSVQTVMAGDYPVVHTLTAEAA
jgi:hypothetical protein